MTEPTPPDASPIDSATTEHRSADDIVVDQIDAQLDQVEARLVDEYGSVDAETVRRHVRAEREHFADAKVHVFVPILVERAVRDKLAG